MASRLNLLHASEALQPTDAALLSALADDARVTNTALAEAVGLPASTCLNRVRTLRRSGWITGHHTQVDRRSLGLDLAVLVGLVVKDKRAQTVHALIEDLKKMPHIVAVMRTSGTYDLMIQVYVRDTDHLVDDVIDPLTENRNVAGTQTILLHEHWRRISLVGEFFPA